MNKSAYIRTVLALTKIASNSAKQAKYRPPVGQQAGYDLARRQGYSNSQAERIAAGKSPHRNGYNNASRQQQGLRARQTSAGGTYRPYGANTTANTSAGAPAWQPDMTGGTYKPYGTNNSPSNTRTLLRPGSGDTGIGFARETPAPTNSGRGYTGGGQAAAPTSNWSTIRNPRQRGFNVPGFRNGGGGTDMVQVRNNQSSKGHLPSSTSTGSAGSGSRSRRGYNVASFR